MLSHVWHQITETCDFTFFNLFLFLAIHIKIWNFKEFVAFLLALDSKGCFSGKGRCAWHRYLRNCWSGTRPGGSRLGALGPGRCVWERLQITAGVVGLRVQQLLRVRKYQPVLPPSRSSLRLFQTYSRLFNHYAIWIFDFNLFWYWGILGHRKFRFLSMFWTWKFNKRRLAGYTINSCTIFLVRVLKTVFLYVNIYRWQLLKHRQSLKIINAIIRSIFLAQSEIYHCIRNDICWSINLRIYYIIW